MTRSPSSTLEERKSSPSFPVNASPLRTRQIQELESDWPLWIATLFPDYCTEPFADFHGELWSWLWNIRPRIRPKPFVAIWPRGTAKSTSAEIGVVSLGARRQRSYGLYICNTQEQADDHVANIAALLESPPLEAFYPDLAARAVGKYGNSKGWRRNRLRTASGLVVDAMGLDSAARGAKVENQRPDFIIIDDVDDESDSQDATAKKIKAITRKILPAGSSDVAVLAIQNLVHPDSVFSRLADGRADFLADRVVSGPFPAIEDFTYTAAEDGMYHITGGTATWPGQDLIRCQEIIWDIGITSFLSEYQHDVEPPPGGMFDHLIYKHCEWGQVPEMISVVVWIDPAVTDKDSSDSQGIQADGLGVDGKIYRLFSWEQRTSPQDAMYRGIKKAIELGAVEVGVETDQGGDTWDSVYREACGIILAEYVQNHLEPPSLPRFEWEKAGAGYGPKTHRASKMLAYYETGKFVHVEGTHLVLEKALRRFPKTKPLDLADAAFWSFNSLTKPPASVDEYRDNRLAGRR